jgi:hypothetical protein
MGLVKSIKNAGGKFIALLSDGTSETLLDHRIDGGTSISVTASGQTLAELTLQPGTYLIWGNANHNSGNNSDQLMTWIDTTASSGEPTFLSEPSMHKARISDPADQGSSNSSPQVYTITSTTTFYLQGKIRIANGGNAAGWLQSLKIG